MNPLRGPLLTDPKNAELELGVPRDVPEAVPETSLKLSPRAVPTGGRYGLF